MAGTILNSSQLLVKYGFIKSDVKHLYKYDEKQEFYVRKDVKEGEKTYDPKHADEERDEEASLFMGNTYTDTGFPKTVKRFRLVQEAFNMSLENLYFWTLNHLRHEMGLPNVIKVTDMFSASENSAFFGQSAQRLSIQEDRASSFLRGISELVKTLFQIVRELRLLDERLEVYRDWKKSKSADATLKGIFSDFAENKGGQMQPGSIYHLANQVGYAVLPDLFFNTIVYDKDDVDKVVDALGFNQNVKTVLKRKLYQFVVWVQKTQEELEARRKFQIKYLRQHYITIKMYMTWVKPYLKHIRRLTMNEKQLDGPDIISSFETSTTEIEIIAYLDGKNGVNPCALVTYEFNTRPVMQYTQEYHRGPVHIGRGTMTLRAYAWTKHEIAMYKKMKDNEDLELLTMVDDQLKSAMELLGDDLMKYIKEAEGKLSSEEDAAKSEAPTRKEKLEPITSDQDVFGPIVNIFKGFVEIGGLFVPSAFKSQPKKKDGLAEPSSSARKAAIKTSIFVIWNVYKNYKKANGMLAW